MTTTYENPISVIDHDGLPQAIVVTTQFTIKEGDLVFWDGVNFSARPMTTANDATTNKSSNNSEGFIGVAVGSNKPEVYGGEEALPSVPVISKATVFLLSTAGQKYKPFEAVKLGADAQTVSNTSGGTATIGYVIVDPPATARPEQATPVPEEAGGTEQVRIRVLLKPTFVPAAAI